VSQGAQRLLKLLSYFSVVAVRSTLSQVGPGADKRAVAAAGKMDAKKRLATGVTALMSQNIVQAMGTMLDSIVF
jgi:hypothetical protein